MAALRGKYNLIFPPIPSPKRKRGNPANEEFPRFRVGLVLFAQLTIRPEIFMVYFPDRIFRPAEERHAFR